jgi:hypothetical protein
MAMAADVDVHLETRGLENTIHTTELHVYNHLDPMAWTSRYWDLGVVAITTMIHKGAIA